MLVDSSVARNFAIAGWTDILAATCGGTIRVAHGILGLDEDEPGELDRIREALDREAAERPGSSASSLAAAAAVGLRQFIARRGTQVDVIVPTPSEFALALRLQDASEREWLRSLGVRARRLDAGEAVSVAIATSRAESLATDDGAGAAAYQGLGGREHWWTLDLLQRAVHAGLIGEDEARAGYERLCERYRFWGAPWT